MRKWLLAFCCFFLLVDANATHLRGGQVTTRVVDCASHIYEITITLYTDSNSMLSVGDGTLTFGDGTSMIVNGFSPIAIIDPVNSIGVATFKVNHTYSSEKGFLISYGEPNRNSGVLNLSASGQTPLYISSYLLVNSSLCQSLVNFLIPPIDRACTGLSFTHNPGASVTVEDSLSYQLVTPSKDQGTPADGYRDPNNSAFYSGNYSTANEEGNGPPSYSIDSNGTLTWNAPGNAGEYNVAIKVLQWTFINGSWVNVAWVVRDMQIIVKDCDATRPYLKLMVSRCVMVGDTLVQDLRAYDKEGNPVTIDVKGLDDFDRSGLSIKYDGAIQSTQQPNDTAHLTIKWIISCNIPRPKPYRFVFKTSAYLKNGGRISSFQTWDVKVNGPPPAFKSLNLDVARKSLSINWKNYPCKNISTIQIWRRVDHFSANANACAPGIPASWGFVKIGESSTGNFVDRSLSAGATYCYRLLAVYSVADKIVSLVSKDTCIGPIIVDAPVMTKVSIDKTDKTKGKVSLIWTSPFQINRQLFPPPYRYDLLRTANGKDFELLKSKMTDTTFVDSPANTQEETWGYRVVVYSPTSVAGENPIDTSSLASTPRLASKSLQNGIALNWRGDTPWSNRSTRFPWHYVYRKEVDDTNFLLMDSINSTEIDSSVFFYVDEGKIARFAFSPNVIYDYRVETQGAYGNPHIHEPLRNFSNEIHAQPIDKDPPCAPILEIASLPCELIKSRPCSVTDYKNSLHWTYPTGCGNDVASFNVYFFENTETDSTLLASTSDLSFDHNKQTSMAGCYEIIAVDFFGNSSKPSQKICVENCLNVFIPNVVTINSDGLNESFPGFADSADKKDPSTCPRFVQEYSLQIFNCWGERVYSVNNLSPSESDFEWKGWDEKGKELPTGIYYYSTEINFTSIDPKLKTKKVNGWVNLIR